MPPPSTIPCYYHQHKFVTHYCKDPECEIPLCEQCVIIHTDEHRQKGSIPVMDLSANIIQDSIQYIQSLIRDMKNESERSNSINIQNNQNTQKLSENLQTVQERVHALIDQYFRELRTQIVSGIKRESERTQGGESHERVHQSILDHISSLEGFQKKLTSKEAIKHVIVLRTSDYKQKHMKFRADVERQLNSLDQSDVQLEVNESELKSIQESVSLYCSLSVQEKRGQNHSFNNYNYNKNKLLGEQNQFEMDRGVGQYQGGQKANAGGQIVFQGTKQVLQSGQQQANNEQQYLINNNLNKSKRIFNNDLSYKSPHEYPLDPNLSTVQNKNSPFVQQKNQNYTPFNVPPKEYGEVPVGRIRLVENRENIGQNEAYDLLLKGDEAERMRTREMEFNKRAILQGRGESVDASRGYYKKNANNIDRGNINQGLGEFLLNNNNVEENNRKIITPKKENKSGKEYQSDEKKSTSKKSPRSESRKEKKKSSRKEEAERSNQLQRERFNHKLNHPIGLLLNPPSNIIVKPPLENQTFYVDEVGRRIPIHGGMLNTPPGAIYPAGTLLTPQQDTIHPQVITRPNNPNYSPIEIRRYRHLNQEDSGPGGYEGHNPIADFQSPQMFSSRNDPSFEVTRIHHPFVKSLHENLPFEENIGISNEPYMRRVGYPPVL